MSYDYAPEWTKDITLPALNNLACPYCGQVPNNAHEVMEVLQGCTYYAVQHVPPYLTLTCDNPDCDFCDGDYAVYLAVEVRITKIVPCTIIGAEELKPGLS